METNTGPELYCQTEDGTGKDLVHWCQLSSLEAAAKMQIGAELGLNWQSSAVPTLISWGRGVYTVSIYIGDRPLHHLF